MSYDAEFNTGFNSDLKISSEILVLLAFVANVDILFWKLFLIYSEKTCFICNVNGILNILSLFFNT